MPPTTIGFSAPSPTRPTDRRSRPGGVQTGCVAYASVFQDPLLEEPPTAGAPAEVRHRYTQLVSQAQTVCAQCPLVTACLFRAVVDHDVCGYAGGTTPRQRSEIRRRLGVTVEPEDLDTLAGVTGRHRQIDHDEVVRLRNANPQDSLENIARRLGCSLSTVKRHLRRERGGSVAPAAITSVKPTLAQVVAVAAEVTNRKAVRQRAA